MQWQYRHNCLCEYGGNQLRIVGAVLWYAAFHATRGSRYLKDRTEKRFKRPNQQFRLRAKPIPPKRSDRHNSYQAFLLRKLTDRNFGVSGCSVSQFQSPCPAQVRTSAENAGVTNVAAAPTAVMTGTMVMTGTADMAGMDVSDRA